MHREWLSFSFYFLSWSGFESYSISYLCNIGKNSFFDCSILNYKILSRYVLIEKNLSSVLIYLYRSWCSICKQHHRGLSLKNFFQTLLYALQNNSTLFLINNMSFTYTYQKCCSAPTHFLVNTGFTASLYKTICFDHFIKTYIPTPRCLHQSIDGSVELAHFVSTFRIDKTLWLHHIQLFFNKSIKECSIDIHLLDFLKCGNY